MDLIFQPLPLWTALWNCSLLSLSLHNPQLSEKYSRFMIVKLIYKQTLVVVLLHSALLRFHCCMRECMQSHHQWTAMFLQFVVFWYLPVLPFVPFLFFKCDYASPKYQRNRKKATWVQRGTSTAWECQRSNMETRSASSCMWQQDSGCRTLLPMPNHHA